MLMCIRKCVLIALTVGIILLTSGCGAFISQPASGEAASNQPYQTGDISTDDPTVQDEPSTEPEEGATLQTQPDPETEQRDITAMYGDILTGAGTFYSYDYQESLSINEYLTAFASETGTQPEITQYTILDMDGDAVPELLLWIMVNDYLDYGTVVLRVQNEQVEGYTFTYRQMFDLKADGSFAVSGSESGTGFAMLQFAENNWKYIWKYVEIPDDNQDAKESAEWLAYPNA